MYNRSVATGKPDVPRREVEIINFLRTRPDGATVAEIHQEVSAELGDTISRPAYYKLLRRLVAVGKLEELDSESGVLRYILPQQIYSSNRLTLDDVREMMPFVQSTETMARAIEAQQYFFEHRHTVLLKAAQALLEEPAVEIFQLWITDLIDALRLDLESYKLVEEEGPHLGEAVLADHALEHRLSRQCDILREILYRQLSIPFHVVDLPEWDGPGGLKDGGHFYYDLGKLRQALERRVFGVGEAGAVLGSITVPGNVRADANEELVVSGSDGSFHAGTLGIRTAHGFIEDESYVVTFNNGVAYVRSSAKMERQKGGKKFVHSAPVTRQTLDDPTYKGMVLAPFMFPQLDPSEYEHMARAATDVVQMRVDDGLFNGVARDLVTGEQIVSPRVHIRDGTITPQERYFNHYYRMDAYGDIVREGITRSRSILQRIITARSSPPIFAGAVKSTQIKLFSRFVNWYIAQGSKYTQGEAIEPSWDASHADFLSDINVMTSLFATLPPRNERDGFWVSCVVLRQFASLTEFYSTRVKDSSNWFDELLRHRQRALEAHHEQRLGLPYHALLSEEDLGNDPYLYMLERADYCSFYIGHTWGEPAPKIPRYEFLASLRKVDPLDADPASARRHVQSTVEQLVTALLVSKLAEDRDHNFMSRLSLVKLVPFVVYRAHEFAKTLGKKLEADYKSSVVKRLAERRRERIDERDTVIRPIGIQRYLRRYSDALKELPSPDEDMSEC
jgi:Fe2+ or Zn2+ uptake regulation protein